MKKYNRLMTGILILYFAAAVISFCITLRIRSVETKEYLIEINRIERSIINPEDIGSLDFLSYKYVREVLFYPLDENGNISETAFAEVNGAHCKLTSYRDTDGTLQGVLKYVYQEPARSNAILIYFLCILVGVFFILAGILLYVRQQILKPFHEMSEIPVQLSKGHLKEEITETKGKYFGRFLWGIGMLRDKLDHERMKELKLERDKKMLLLSISHDIKTPLNSIKLYVRALEEGVYDSEEQKEAAVHQIGQNAVKIEDFVAEVIRTSSEDILEIEVQNSDFYLKELVEKLSSTYAPKLELRKVDFEISDYDNKLLHGDIDRCFEVCENIFENALKYGNGGFIKISFREEDYCQLIRIQNSGDRVPQEELNHIFDSFYRGTNTSGKQGNGLGLYICREIMRKMDGEIFAETMEDGMCFTLVLR